MMLFLLAVFHHHNALLCAFPSSVYLGLLLFQVS